MMSIGGVTKRYPGSDVNALDNVSFDVTAGSVCCLIGRNGAGKSTLMSAIVGLHPLTAGQVTLNGTSLPDSPELRREVGYAAQAEALYPLLTAWENLTVFGRLAGLNKTDLRRRALRVVEALRLTEVLDQPVRVLSGGERRRIHVAIALLRDYSVVMLDEPTAGVDPITRSDVLGLVSDAAAAGAIVLYSTHYLHEVEQLDGAVVMLERGRVVSSGTVPSVLAEHGTAWIEMRFARRPDTTSLPWVNEWQDGCLTVRAHQPSEELPRILERLSDDVVNLQSLEIREANLETVFFDLTGLHVVEENLGDVESV